MSSLLTYGQQQEGWGEGDLEAKCPIHVWTPVSDCERVNRVKSGASRQRITHCRTPTVAAWSRAMDGGDTSMIVLKRGLGVCHQMDNTTYVPLSASPTVRCVSPT